MKRLKSFNYRKQKFGATISPFFILKSQKFADFVPANLTKTNLTIFQLFMLFAFLNENYEIVQ